MILQSKKSSFKFTECSFSVNKNSKFANFYHNGGKGIKSALELDKCIFTGQLNNNAYFIDGKSIDKKNLLNLIINDCKFPCKLNKVLNPKSKFDLTEIRNNSKEMNKLKFISIFAVLSVALVASIAIVLTKKLNKSNYSNDQKEEIEI